MVKIDLTNQQKYVVQLQKDNADLEERLKEAEASRRITTDGDDSSQTKREPGKHSPEVCLTRTHST